MTAGPPESSPKRGSGLSRGDALPFRWGTEGSDGPTHCSSCCWRLAGPGLDRARAEPGSVQLPRRLRRPDRRQRRAARAVERQARHQLHHPQLPGRNEHELQFRQQRSHAVSDHLRQRPAYRADVVQRRRRPQDLVRQQLHRAVFTRSCQNAFIPVEKIDKKNPGQYAVDRRAVHVSADDPGAVRSAHRHRSSTTRARSTICTASSSPTISTRPALRSPT